MGVSEVGHREDPLDGEGGWVIRLESKPRNLEALHVGPFVGRFIDAPLPNSPSRIIVSLVLKNLVRLVRLVPPLGEPPAPRKRVVHGEPHVLCGNAPSLADKQHVLGDVEGREEGGRTIGVGTVEWVPRPTSATAGCSPKLLSPFQLTDTPEMKSTPHAF